MLLNVEFFCPGRNADCSYFDHSRQLQVEEFAELASENLHSTCAVGSPGWGTTLIRTDSLPLKLMKRSPNESQSETLFLHVFATPRCMHSRQC